MAGAQYCDQWHPSLLLLNAPLAPGFINLVVKRCAPQLVIAGADQNDCNEL
jgi:hypothetical protein